ncbi:histidine--tRNA ligase [Bartonella melophagi]|uniref:Histidine--tRNA ligase n=1 Tax=Bartonella melophagi K-2C TaxID=1094557 RepID=J0QZC5_9HYPH|nr:histidine--tRNA ligase [Bartonella melophagi]EJF88574.1 histidyl-tRNA synthetase [Bartonella melophagi K-2C]
MSTKQKKIKARLPRGLTDYTGLELQALEEITAQIREVYELYGFEALETPIFEYTDALGKSLPDVDRPNAGVFSLQDDDEQWMSLRYDLTAPLARYVAENFEVLPKPYRSYRLGYVFRNDKPGPGRFRQFMQLDADIVGASTVAADAEICMMAADSLNKLIIGSDRGVIRVSNRKILDGVLENLGLGGDEQADRRLSVFRAIDKWDRLGFKGVELLLGEGRLDESGDFTKGAELTDDQIKYILSLLRARDKTAEGTINNLKNIVDRNACGLEGIHELEEMLEIFATNGYESYIKVDPSVVRGLDYYTGPVFEARFFNGDLPSVFANLGGSVGGGGRYDGLIGRFRNDNVPATGFSIGLSRLRFAILGVTVRQKVGPVVVLMMDQEPSSIARYQNMVKRLRDAGIRSEVYLGESGIKAQMKYADRRHAPCVVIQGSQELQYGEVQIKDLVEGARLATEIKDNQTWRESRPAQITVKENQLVQAVKAILENQKR